MKKNINTINLLSLGLIVFSVICLVLRSIALLTAFDTHIGYFEQSAIITHFDRSFFAVSVIFGIVVSFLIQRSSISQISPASLWSTFSSLLFGFIWAVCALLLIISGISKSFVLGYVAVASAIGSAAYYIYEGFRPIKTLGMGRVLAALLPMISLLSMTFFENFDLYVALNNPEKQLIMFVFVIATLYMIQKLKFHTDSPSPRLYACSSYLTVFLSIYFAIPGIIGNLAHVTDEPRYLVYSLLALGIAIYSATDLVGRIRLSSFEESNESVSIEK